jgi:hypothetical protein
MDTKTLITEAKARFNHNAAKAQLKDKYDGKLIVADQGGLWKADTQTISFLNSLTDDTIVAIDNFDNPVEVKRTELLEKLKETYTKVMNQWYIEWKELESKR